MIGNNAICKIIRIGSVNLKQHNRSIMELKYVRFVPDLKGNLISLGILNQIGYSVKIESGEMMIIKGIETIIKGLRKNNLFALYKGVVTSEVYLWTNSNNDKTKLWHLKLRHIREKGLEVLDKQSVLEYDKIGSLEFCMDYILGKATRASFKRSIYKSRGKLEYIHPDF